MGKTIQKIKRLIPSSVLDLVRPAYHFAWALFADVKYGHPSGKIKVIGITGTKGKSSVSEMVNSILETAGKKTALINGIRFKIGDTSVPNRFKMTMPGKGFVQKKLREAVEAGCEIAVVEITSEGAKQFRNKFIDLDALVFTNLSPEHIESHGSYEAYRDAKLDIGRGLEKSPKKNKAIIANKDDAESEKFLALRVPLKIPFSLLQSVPYSGKEGSTSFTWNGETIRLKTTGVMNISNALAAAFAAKHFGASDKAIKTGLESLASIRGRMEKIDEGQPFGVYVDYAHTADSLDQAYKSLAGKNLICVLGATGGGRDKWKRPAMGAIADKYCSKIILTNEDPYDEDPEKIIADVAEGIKKNKPEIILDRRDAMRKALSIAGAKDSVIITGKGSDPFLMEANGEKTPWDDAKFVREDLCVLLRKNKT